MLATWRQTLEHVRYRFLLGIVSGVDLDDLGRYLQMPRKQDELDDPYADRIQKRILQKQITPSAFKQLVSELTDGAVSSELIEPWSKVKLRGDTYPRSGQGRRPDDSYFRGATFDVVTGDYVAPLETAINERKLYGSKGYQTLRQEAQYSINDDPKAATVPVVGRSHVVTASMRRVVLDAVCSADADTSVAAFELKLYHDSFVDWDQVLTAVIPHDPDNLSRNYALSVDMLNSAATGSPVYTVVSGPLTPVTPTDIQPGVLIQQVP